jgi:predicted nuclease with TOPRIM domain
MDYTSISILTSTLAATAIIAVFVRESSIRERELREERRALSDEIDRLRDENEELQDDYDELEKEYEELEERCKKLDEELEEQHCENRKSQLVAWHRLDDMKHQKDEILVTVLVFTMVTLVVGGVLSLYLVSRPNAPVAY